MTRQETHAKPISATVHSVIDYVIILVFLLAPSVIGLTGVFAFGSYGLAAAHLLLTVTTQSAAELFPVLSFRIHGLIELVVAFGLVVSPWLFNFAAQSTPRNFFLVSGLLLIVIGFFTQYQSQDASQKTTDNTEAAESVEKPKTNHNNHQHNS